MPSKYTHCVDCGEPKTTYSQRLSPRCNACSGKQKRGEGEHYTHCIDCGEEKPLGTSRRSPRCRECAYAELRKHDFFEVCQRCGEPKARGRSKLCRSCANKKKWEQPRYREKAIGVLTSLWEDGGVHFNKKKPPRHKITPEERRRQQSKRSKENWQNPEIRERNLRGIRRAWENNHKRKRATSKRQTQIMWESGRAFRILYDTCQECGRPKTRNDRELCLSCAGIKRMTELMGNEDRDYPIGFCDTLKERIRERDHRKCVLCGKTEKENGRRLDVHHIDDDKHNLDEHNLISLCLVCHGRMRWNREFWQQFLPLHFRQLKPDWQRKVVVTAEKGGLSMAV